MYVQPPVWSAFSVQVSRIQKHKKYLDTDTAWMLGTDNPYPLHIRDQVLKTARASSSLL